VDEMICFCDRIEEIRLNFISSQYKVPRHGERPLVGDGTTLSGAYAILDPVRALGAVKDSSLLLDVLLDMLLSFKTLFEVLKVLRDSVYSGIVKSSTF
jgi:hypothetical protein